MCSTLVSSLFHDALFLFSMLLCYSLHSPLGTLKFSFQDLLQVSNPYVFHTKLIVVYISTGNKLRSKTQD